MLIPCPECKTNVSEHSTQCPKCGFRIRLSLLRLAGGATIVAGLLILVGLLAVFWPDVSGLVYQAVTGEGEAARQDFSWYRPAELRSGSIQRLGKPVFVLTRADMSGADVTAGPGEFSYILGWESLTPGAYRMVSYNGAHRATGKKYMTNGHPPPDTLCTNRHRSFWCSP